MGTYEWQSPADKEKAERKLDDAATFLRDASNAIAIRDARIAALEATERKLREAVNRLAVASMGAEDAKWRMRECQKSIAGACGQTVQECFAAMRYHNVPSSIFDRYDDAMQAAMSNPIAAEAVREAGR